MQLPERASKIIEQESRGIEEILSRVRGSRAVTSQEALDAVVELMNRRSRYFGQTGEHFPVQEYEGILVIDALDEKLLKAIRELLHGWVHAQKRTPDLKVLKHLGEKLGSRLRELSERPVGFEVLFLVRAAFEALDDLLEGDSKHAHAELKHAFVHQLLGFVDRYVQTRERPVVRHFSDIAREYSVVSRLKCTCGEEKFEVKMQALCQTQEGEPYDRMDLQCRACGRQRSVTFSLPYFKDMYQIS